MFRIFLVLGAVFYCVIVSPNAASQTAAEIEYLRTLEAQLPGELVNNPIDLDWSVNGSDYSSKSVEAKNTPLGVAFRIKIKKQQRDPWDIAINAPVKDGVAKGDVILVAFWARATSPEKEKGQAQIQMRFQMKSDPFTGIVEKLVDLNETWQIHYVRGRAEQDYKAGATNVSFNVGMKKQTLEFGPLYVMDLGPDANLDTLPNNSVDME